MNTDPWDRISLAQGDITKLAADVIVNAANTRLSGGGGVDGAIHRAAGWPAMKAACAAHGGCPTGDARITPGFALPARFVLHAVGPIYAGGGQGEAALLASCYRRCLEIADQHGLRSIAFPAISTGVYGYPFEPATEIALATVASTLTSLTRIEAVVFIFFSESDFGTAKGIHARLRGEAPSGRLRRV